MVGLSNRGKLGAGTGEGGRLQSPSSPPAVGLALQCWGTLVTGATSPPAGLWGGGRRVPEARPPADS